MDTKHLDELAHYIKEQLGVTTKEEMPLIFNDYCQEYLTNKIMEGEL